MQQLEANSIAQDAQSKLKASLASLSRNQFRAGREVRHICNYFLDPSAGSRMFHYTSCLSLRKIVAIVNVSRGVTVTDCNRLPGFFCTVLCINLFLLCPALLLCRKKIAKQQHSWAQNDRHPQSLQMDLNVSAISVIFTWRKFRLENLKHVVTCMQRRTSLL